MKNIIEIGLPCSPSKKELINRIVTTKIVISYGGGVGGSSQTLYAKKIEKNGIFYNVELIDGTKEEINENFIVKKVPDVTILECVFDITAHLNYHSKTVKKAKKVMYFKLNHDEDYLFVNKYIDTKNVINQRTYTELL